MAIVDLGTQQITPVRLPFYYTPVTLGDALGNLLLVTITRDFITDPVSYLDLTARLTIPGQGAFLTQVLGEFDLLSPVYGIEPVLLTSLPPTTEVEYGITRMPVFRGGADGGTLSVQLQINIP